jgi:hypothetical protein
MLQSDELTRPGKLPGFLAGLLFDGGRQGELLVCAMSQQYVLEME